MDKAFFETSMFLEPFKKKNRKEGNYGKRAFAILNKLTTPTYRNVVSGSVLGEVEIVLCDPETCNRYDKSVEDIKEDHKQILKKFEVVGIKKESIHLASEILKNDKYISPFDALNFACAIVEECQIFFFIDKTIKKSAYIQKLAKERNIALSPFDLDKNRDR